MLTPVSSPGYIGTPKFNGPGSHSNKSPTTQTNGKKQQNRIIMFF